MLVVAVGFAYHFAVLRAVAFELCRKVPGSYELLKQGQDKFGLFNQRVTVIAIGGVHVQCIQMGIGRCRDPDDLAV